MFEDVVVVNRKAYILLGLLWVLFGSQGLEAAAATSASESVHFQLTIRPEVGVTCPSSPRVLAKDKKPNITCRLEKNTPHRGVLALSVIPSSGSSVVGETSSGPETVLLMDSPSFSSTVLAPEGRESLWSLPIPEKSVKPATNSPNTLFFAFI